MGTTEVACPYCGAITNATTPEDDIAVSAKKDEPNVISPNKSEAGHDGKHSFWIQY